MQRNERKQPKARKMFPAKAETIIQVTFMDMDIFGIRFAKPILFLSISLLTLSVLDFPGTGGPPRLFLPRGPVCRTGPGHPRKDRKAPAWRTIPGLQQFSILPGIKPSDCPSEEACTDVFLPAQDRRPSALFSSGCRPDRRSYSEPVRLSESPVCLPLSCLP